MNSGKFYSSVHSGYISFKWLYGYTYEVKYTIYTSNPINYCEIETVCFGDGTSAIIPRSNGGSALCAPPARDGVYINPSINKSEYKITHTYPGPGNYLVCISLPNRTQGIVNFSNSVNTSFYAESNLTIPVFSTGNNSSPNLLFEPVINGCLNNNCIDFNFSATDVDGDSLTYEIVPYVISGTSLPNASSSFSINIITGLLSWCNPLYEGDYNAIIKITEWRKNSEGNNVVVGSVSVDTRFVISLCTGEKEIENSSISAYPNPTTNKLFIKLNSFEVYLIELMSVEGLIISSQLTNKSDEYALDFETLPSGVYFLKITDKEANSVIIKKILKD